MDADCYIIMSINMEMTREHENTKDNHSRSSKDTYSPTNLQKNISYYHRQYLLIMGSTLVMDAGYPVLQDNQQTDL
jgi:hypothetical protein